MHFESLESEFEILGALRVQAAQMPHDVLLAHYLLTHKALMEQQAIYQEVCAHLDTLRNTLAAVSKKPPKFSE